MKAGLPLAASSLAASKLMQGALSLCLLAHAADCADADAVGRGREVVEWRVVAGGGGIAQYKSKM